MKQRKQLQTLLSEKKLKKTSQRALIWSALLEMKGHPSVEQIRDRIVGTLPIPREFNGTVRLTQAEWRDVMWYSPHS